jgi:RNA polymerase sigma-70 factor (ECF subfamily)
MNDAELRVLASRIKASDPQAFEWVFNLYHETIFRFLLFKTKDYGAAEDLLQDAFLKLWKTRASLNEDHSIKNYLYTIADNLALNHIRHSKVVTRHQAEAAPKLFSEIANPQFLLEEKEWNERLSKALEALPDQTRVIFLMSRMEDLTYEEIGERLSLSKKTVEGNIVKALKQLREIFSFKI